MNDNQNKQMLWELLKDNRAFDNFDNKDYKTIIHLFNETVNTIDHRTPNLDLIKKNKIFIQDIMQKLSNLKNKPKKINIMKDEYVLTHEEIQNLKRDEFEKNLQNQQNDFNNSMKVEIPKEIDFSDKNDEKPLNDIDRLIQSKLKERSYDNVPIVKSNEETNESVKPKETNESVKPKETDESVKPKETDESVKPKETKKDDKLNEDVKEIKEVKNNLSNEVTNDIFRSLSERISKIEEVQQIILNTLSEKLDISLN